MIRTIVIRAVRVLAVTALLLSMVTGPVARAEEKTREPGKWYPAVETGFTLTQSTFSGNWAGGDKGSVVWTAILNATLENQLNSRVNWHNVLKLAYGQTHQQAVAEDGQRFWQRPEKSTDLIDFETVFRFTFDRPIDPYLSARLESQFEDASDPSGRTLAMNPIQLKESAGLARKFIDEEDRNLLTRLGVTLRQSRRRLFTGAAPSQATESSTTNDGGIEWMTDYKAQLLDKRVTWTSKLTAYQPLFYSEKGVFDDLTDAQIEAAGLDPDIAGFTTTMDIDWENIFTSQITKLLSVNLYLLWVYDKYDNSVPPKTDAEGAITNAADVLAAVRKAGQFKQTLSIGITYRFP